MLSTSLPHSTQYRLFVCLLLLAGLLLAGAGVIPASAQQPDSVEVDTTGPDSTWTVASVERKSPERAVLYSAGGTLLTFVSGIGIIVGPSFGHFYANDYSRAWGGIAWRTGGLLLAGTLGLAGLATTSDAAVLGAGLAFIGVLGHALHDIVTAWNSAKEYNESHDVSAQVAPTVGPQGEQVGLSLSVQL